MMLQAWNTLPQPVVGRIHGNALGGGVGLASICDVAVGVDGALMGLTETKLGLIFATIGPYVIVRMGEASARRAFMSSRQFSAQEAQQLGLLASVFPQDRLNSAVAAEVEPYLSWALGGVVEAKFLTRFLGPKTDSQAIEMTISALVSQWEGDAAGQGIVTFFCKNSTTVGGWRSLNAKILQSAPLFS